jgi:hypothetical protein
VAKMRSGSRVRAFVLALLTVTAAACATRAPNIADIKFNPGRYVDRRVTVEGTVTSAWRVPFVDFGLYSVKDESGDLTVLSRAHRTPTAGARVRVTGVVKDVATIGQPIGLHLQERDVDVLR